MMRQSAQLHSAASSTAGGAKAQGGHRTARARYDIEVGDDDKVTMLHGKQHAKL